MSEAIMIGFAVAAVLALYLIKIRLDWIVELIRSRDTALIPLEGKVDEMRRLLDTQLSHGGLHESQLRLIESRLDLIESWLERIDSRLDK
jgi:hypothetical protein